MTTSPSARGTCVAAACVALAVLLPAARPSQADDDAAYETAPAVNTADVTRADVLAGPHHKVRATATPDDFLYRFEMESDYGLFPVTGRRMLVARAKEVETMAKLLAMDQGGEFMKSLGGRLGALPDAAIDLVKDPVGSVEAMEKGVGRTLGRVGDLFGGRKSSKSERSSPDDVLFGQEKRKLAYELDVDPYSSNSKLQTLLDEVARARGAGRLAVDGASYAIPGGAASVAFSVVKMRDDVKSMLRDHTPAELDRLNDEKLAARGVPSFLRRQFSSQRSLSPTHRTAIAAAIAKLDGVADASPVVAACLDVADEPRAVVRVEQAMLLAHHHTAIERLASLDVLGGVVVARTVSGRVVVHAAVDYVPWTESIDRAARGLLALDGVAAAPSRDLYLSGRATPRAAANLARLGFTLHADFVPR